ncbi:MAG: DUF3089 domain-containing protein [Bacteroidales bacterium]
MRSETKITGWIACIVFIALSLCATSCKKTEKQSSNTDEATDYSIATHWLNIPATIKPVDVFYLYPTVWTPDSATNPLYSEIDDASMLKGSAFAFSDQATAFETAGNVYAPYYRQANAIRTLVLPEDQRWQMLSQAPAKDVIAAFDYYINHFNNGRPFILAGHSQGANLLLFILSEYMKKFPAVYSRMIAAYVTGYPVTADFMAANKHLKFAQGPDDSGVIISYNTQSPKVVQGTNIVVGNNVGLVINPISWKRDETLATASESLGSLWFGENHSFVKVLNFADARIDLTQGVLICSSVNDSAMYKFSGFMGLGVYHSFDIPFYYYNLRENAENRAGKFLNK